MGYCLKLTKEDGVYLIYRGVQTLVVDNSSFGRNGTKSPSLTVYTLENNKRILPVHFHFSFSKIPGDIFKWLLKANYPSSLLREVMSKPNPFLKMIPKDDTWKGAYFPVPMECKK